MILQLTICLLLSIVRTLADCQKEDDKYAQNFEESLNNTLSSVSDENVKSQSKEVFEDALMYLLSRKGEKLVPILDPLYSGCAWLEVGVIDRAGLGHTLASYSKYMRDAANNKLAYHSSFYLSISQHDHICDFHETANFFGLHPVYFWTRSPPKSAVRIDIQQRGGNCTSADITSAVIEYKNRHGNFNCGGGQNHVVFICHNQNIGQDKRASWSSNGVLLALRGPFIAGYRRNKVKHMHPSLHAAKIRGGLVVAVHIRRGDILQMRAHDRDLRLVSYRVTSDIIKILIHSRLSHEIKTEPVTFLLICEGAKTRDTIPNFYHKGNKLIHMNVSTDMATACIAPSCQIEVVWDADFYQSFVIMCESDLLVTSISGFSWTAAVLCDVPLVVNFPWGDYEGVDNVVPIAASGPLWADNSTVRIPNIHTGWRNLVGRYQRHRREMKPIVSGGTTSAST